MQSLYMKFVSERDRRVFGEYYTPDWLAALVVDEALDDAWRSNAIEHADASTRTGNRLAGGGVLDPTCDSGTFLYHAARRILDAPEIRKLTAVRQADITASLVHGIDVHPVAVEIAKTNMLRVLPATPTAGAAAIQIRMGDSLMAVNEATDLFDVQGTMRIVTPRGHEISLPMSFVRRATFAEDMGRLVDAAIGDDPIPEPVLTGLDTADLAGSTPGDDAGGGAAFWDYKESATVQLGGGVGSPARFRRGSANLRGPPPDRCEVSMNSAVERRGQRECQGVSTSGPAGTRLWYYGPQGAASPGRRAEVEWPRRRR